MKPQTRDILSELDGLDTVRSKLARLHNAYAGATCYLLSCGPSLGTFSSQWLRDRFRDELVVAIKQAYVGLAGLTDFHLLNAENVPRNGYRYPDPRPVIVATTTAALALSDATPRDITLEISDAGNLGTSLAASGRFDDWLLEETPDRPFGPGIMHEIGVYLPVHLGVKRIVTLGFDMADRGHFYSGTEEEKEMSDRFKSRVVPDAFLAASTRCVVESLAGVHRWLAGKGISWEYVETEAATKLEGIVPPVRL